VAEVAAAGRGRAAAGDWNGAARLLAQAARIDAETGAEAVEALVFDGQVDQARALEARLGPGARHFASGVLAHFAGRTAESAVLLTLARSLGMDPVLRARIDEHLALSRDLVAEDHLRLMRHTAGSTERSTAGGPSPAAILDVTVAALAAYRRGHWDEALSRCEYATAAADDLGPCWISAHAHAAATLVPAARGDWHAAGRHLAAARRLGREATAPAAVAGLASAAAHLAAARNRPDEVIGLLAPLLDAGHDAGTGTPPWRDLLAEALIAVRALDRARAVPAPSPLVRARLLAAGRETEAAREAFAEACAVAEEPFDRARILLAYGSFLRRAGRRAEAAERLSAALHDLRALRALPYAERCQTELAACGRPQDGPASGLTPQQDAVARLVATGMTNRQIARELWVTVKTVEYHLGQIYARLGVSSRVALARAVSTWPSDGTHIPAREDVHELPRPGDAARGRGAVLT
jgi:DNA-binding CsgD family transcriptional regulator